MIPRIRQVRIRNYKSIEHAVVDLEPFTALIGPNGAGKSNFLDALAFVQDALSTSLDMAFKNRGGIGAVRRRSGGHPPNIALRFSLDLGDDRAADYEFEVTAKPREQFRVASERCAVGRFPEQEHVFEVQDGEFRQAIPGVRPKVRADRLALAAASTTEEFGPVYDFLSSMRFYSIVPERLREWQEPDPGDFLHSDGRNAAAVLRRLAEEVHSAEDYKRLCRFLARVADGIEAVEYRAVGKRETLQFKQNIGLKHSGTFDAASMSDGTLRLVGLLLAIFQPGAPSLVAIEEPAAMVYPAVAELVVKALLDAANERQILVATHSPDILNCKELTDAHIRVAAMERDGTAIAPVSLSNRQAIQNHFYTPGQLLRSHEISPDLVAAREMIEQLDLFGKPNPDSGGTP